MNTPILLYHSIETQATTGFKPWCMQPERFEEQLAYLQEEGYTALTLRELRSRVATGRLLPERPVVLTFDDAYLDFLTQALPRLEKYGHLATLFVPTAYVGGCSSWLADVGEAHRPILGWKQLRALQDVGIECGGHTHSHPELDTLSARDAALEICQSRDLLEEALGQPVYSMAYPHGYYNRRVRQMVMQAGYMAACAGKHAMSFPGDDPFALARIDMRSHVGVEEFHAFLNGDLPQTVQNEPFRTTAWRLVRRTKLHRHYWIQQIVERLASSPPPRPE